MVSVQGKHPMMMGAVFEQFYFKNDGQGGLEFTEFCVVFFRIHPR
jgi:hypothetical protein